MVRWLLVWFSSKKTVDSWLRNYVVFTGFLFSERLIFDSVVRLYIDFFVNTVRGYMIFEAPNISSILNTILFIYFTLFMVLMLSSIILV